MTDRAEPGVTPLTEAEPRLPGESPCHFVHGFDGWTNCATHGWTGSREQRSRVLICPDAAGDPQMIRAYRETIARLDAATPRPGLVEAAQAVVDHRAGKHGIVAYSCGGRFDEHVDALAAALASGTGEPGLDGLADTSRIEVAINRFADAAKLPRPYCARYWGSDGTLCSTHHGRFPDPSAVRCDAHARLANDKGADPTPEPK